MFHKGYFKGWYFKCCTADKTIAFIPAYHRSDGKETASLQVITDDAVFHIPAKTFSCGEKPLWVQLEDGCFSEKGIALQMKQDGVQLEGTLRFQQLSPIRYDIMGPFRYVPFMQCRHGVYSMKHRIDGQIFVNGQTYTFENGVGYIEGDRGYSFPKRYIWTQCDFADGSLMLSVADIPLCGRQFTGIIGVVLLHGREYRMATYLGARVKAMDAQTITVEQGDYQLTARLLRRNAHPLNAPVGGRMDRTIRESASTAAYYCFSHQNKPLCEFESSRASFEWEYK